MWDQYLERPDCDLKIKRAGDEKSSAFEYCIKFVLHSVLYSGVFLAISAGFRVAFRVA